MIQLYLVYKRTENIIKMFESQIQSLISGPLNFPVDLTKTVLSLIFNILLSPLFRCFESPVFRNLYSLFLGLFNVFFLLNQWAIEVILSSVLPYVLMIFFPSHRFLLACILSIILLLFVHLHRFLFDFTNWKVDCSTFAMIMVTKVTYFALQLSQQQSKQALKAKQQQSSEQNNKKVQQNRLSEYTFLNYFGYCFYFPSVLAGPTFNFVLYRDFIYRRGSSVKAPFTKALYPLIVVSILFVPTALAILNFPSTWCLQSSFYLSLPLVAKILLHNVLGLSYRLKYYIAWYLSQTAVNLTGLSYGQNDKFDAVVAGDIQFEFEANPNKKTRYWSASLQVWLKKVVYEPCFSYTKSKMISTFTTFAISAFWHGVYLVYYTGFLQWAILTELCKWVYKWSLLLPQKISSSKIFGILTYVFASSLFNYIGMTMVLLDWDSSCQFCSTVSYWGSWTLGLTFLLSFLLKPPRQSNSHRE